MENLKILEKLISNFNALIKTPFDGINQFKFIQTIKQLVEILKSNTIPRKKFTDYQHTIEDALYNFVISNKTTNNIINSYIVQTYLALFDFGLNTRINDFISKYSSLINSSKSSLPVKQFGLWLLGNVATKTMYISPNLPDLVSSLIKQIKNNESNIQVKREAMKSLYFTMKKKTPSLANALNDVIKLISKQIKYPEFQKELLFIIESTLFYINTNNMNTHYLNIINPLLLIFENPDKEIKKLAVQIYVDFYIEKVFDPNINTRQILRRKLTEQPKNFLEMILCYGQLIIFNDNMNFNLKQSMIMVIRLFLEKYSDYFNSSETLIVQLLDLITNHFQILYANFIDNSANIKPLSSKSSLNINNKHYDQETNRTAFELEELYKTYIKIIYNSTYRQTLLKHIIKKLTTFQGKLDKLENFKIKKENIDFKVRIDKKTGKEIKEIYVKEGDNNKNISEKEKESNSQKEIGFNEGKINALLICLIEFSEHNYDIFEQVYPNFNDLSKTLLVYLSSNIKAFRMLINRVLINFAYFIPSYRASILPLILNLCSVSHAELASLKNTCLYLADENSNEYKYASIVRNNLDLLKDVCNCLGVTLATFSHKSNGLSVDLAYASLSVAKNMIIGKFTDEEDSPRSLSVRERAKKYNFMNSDADFHKEAGWILIQGLASMDYIWIKHNFKSLFQLWQYVFNSESCELSEKDVHYLSLPHTTEKEGSINIIEFKESFISEFFIKKAALAALRKFIISCFDFIHTQSFQLLVPKFLSHALDFFIENTKVVDFCKVYLKDNYKDLKVILYDCYFSLPINTYQDKFKTLLYSLADDITTDYNNNSNNPNNINADNNDDKNSIVFSEYVFNHLNYFDTLFCDHMLNPNFCNNKNSNIENINNMFHIDHFFLEKYNINLTNKLSNSINSGTNSHSKLIDSSINLLIEILMDENLNQKNKHQILKHFLTQMNDVAIKNFKDSSKISKCLNITFCCFLLLKKSLKRGILILNDESIFTNLKMIFDIGMKVDNVLVKRVSIEGHALLVRLSSNLIQNLHYYLVSIEVKFKNDTSSINEDGVYNLYLIANIFRVAEISSLNCTSEYNNEKVNLLESYVNLTCSLLVMTSNSNIIDSISNPYISQSVFIISEVLIKHKQFNLVRHVIKYYKQTHLFVKNSISNEKNKEKENQIYFRDVLTRNLYNEVKLLIIYTLLGENASSDEKEWFEFFLKKFINDETYKDKKVKLLFLYLAKVSLSMYNNDSKDKDKVNILSFFKDKVFIDYLKQFLISYDYGKEEVSGSFYECKLALEILIIVLLEDKNPNAWAGFVEKIITKLNVVYHFNRNPYFMNDIFSSTYNHPSSTEFLFYSTPNSSNEIVKTNQIKDYVSSVYSLKKIYSIIDSEESTINKTSTIISDAINPNYTLIKHIKLFIKIYIERMVFLIRPNIVINFVKEVSTNPITLYQKRKEGEGLTSFVEDNKDYSKELESDSEFITINKMTHYIHTNMKKFLIKQILSSVTIYMDNIKPKLEAQFNATKNSEQIMEVMNCFMNCCLNLISNSEEFFEIKQLGLELLIKVIDTFKKYPDTRVDYFLLLIQQWEAGISPSFKTVFNTNLSIKGAFLGLKILYKYITIPITSEIGFLSKKLETIVDLNNLTNRMKLATFSEKNDFLLVCKKLNLLCYLYLTNIGYKDVKLYCIQNLTLLDKEEVEIFNPKYHKDFIKELKMYFNKEKLIILIANLIALLDDFNVILNSDRKVALSYKHYNFLFSGNRITYSTRKIFKYSQLYIKVLSFLLNDTEVISLLSDKEESKEIYLSIKEKSLVSDNILVYIDSLIIQEDKTDNNNNNISSSNSSNQRVTFKSVFAIINFLTHYTGLKYRNTTPEINNSSIQSTELCEPDITGEETAISNFKLSGRSSEAMLYSNPKSMFMNNIHNTEVLVFSENDVNNEIKEKVIMKIIVANNLTESLYIILNSSFCTIDKNTLDYLINYCQVLLKLNNFEITSKIFHILEKLSGRVLQDSLTLQKDFEKNKNNNNEKPPFLVCNNKQEFYSFNKLLLQIFYYFISKDTFEFNSNAMLDMIISNQKTILCLSDILVKNLLINANVCYEEVFYNQGLEMLIKLFVLNKDSTVCLQMISKFVSLFNGISLNFSNHIDSDKENKETNKKISDDDDEFEDVEENINSENDDDTNINNKDTAVVAAHDSLTRQDFLNDRDNKSAFIIRVYKYSTDTIFNTIRLLVSKLKDNKERENININKEKVLLLIMFVFQQLKEVNLSEMKDYYNKFEESFYKEKDAAEKINDKDKNEDINKSEEDQINKESLNKNDFTDNGDKEMIKNQDEINLEKDSKSSIVKESEDNKISTSKEDWDYDIDFYSYNKFYSSDKIIRNNILQFYCYTNLTEFINENSSYSVANNIDISLLLQKSFLNIAKRMQNDSNTKIIIEEYLILQIQSWNTNQTGSLFSEDLLALINYIVFSEANSVKRKLLLSIIILFINEIIGLTQINVDKLGELVIKLTIKDDDISILKTISGNLNHQLLSSIDKAYKLKIMLEHQRKEEVDRKNKEMELQKQQEAAKSECNKISTNNNDTGKPGGFKLKALKFGK